MDVNSSSPYSVHKASDFVFENAIDDSVSAQPRSGYVVEVCWWWVLEDWVLLSFCI